MNIKPLKISILTSNNRFDSEFSNTIEFNDIKLEISLINGTICGITIPKIPDLFLKTITLQCSIPLPRKTKEYAFVKEGFQSWSYSGMLSSETKQKKSFADFVNRLQENTNNRPSGKKGHHSSDQYFFLGTKSDGNGILAAQHPPFNQHVEYNLHFQKHTAKLDIIWDFQQLQKKNTEYKLDEIIITSGNINALLSEYGNSVKEKMNLKHHTKLRTGWCSWYYYFTKITPEIILKNLETAVNNKLNFDFFQIDDGYQSTIGDWLRLKPEFENKMHFIANEIKIKGYIPGLWVAPFIISKKSQHFNKPGWVLREKNGKPCVAGINPAWNGYYYALDVTHPEVKNYLIDVFSVIKNDWGFDYIKLDFMYAAFLPGNHYDKSLSASQRMKEAMELIRNAVREDTVILGCGMPISSAIGHVDAMRISCDVAPYWKPCLRDKIFMSDSMVETRGALRNNSVRSFMNNRFWINDPDCLMIRDSNTKLSKEERNSLQAILMISGGMLVFSDDMTLYSSKKADDLKNTLFLFEEMKGGNVTCLDIASKKHPEILFNDRGFFSVSNFSPHKKIIKIDMRLLSALSIKQIKSIDSGEVYESKTEIAVELKKHDTKLFRTL